MLRIRRPVLTVVAAFLAAVGAVVVGPAPTASASVAWSQVTMTCATGAITSSTIAAKVITLKGWIKPCASSPAGPSDFFAIGWYYYPNGTHTAKTLDPMLYGSNTGTTNFSVEIDMTTWTPALCLAYGPSSRLSCVNVAWSGGVESATTISTTHTKVAMALPDPEPTLFPKAVCATCWPREIVAAAG